MLRLSSSILYSGINKYIMLLRGIVLVYLYYITFNLCIMFVSSFIFSFIQIYVFLYIFYRYGENRMVQWFFFVFFFILVIYTFLKVVK